MVLSDQSPISLLYKESQTTKSSPRWLQNSEFIKFVGEQIDLYFTINTAQTSAAIRWEAFQAFIRGQMISYTSSKSNKDKQKLLDLDAEIRELEKIITIDKSVQLEQKLLALKAEYEELFTLKAESSILRLKQTFYDQGEKPSKLLAWQLKKLTAERAINEIRNERGEIIIDPAEINNTFVSFYKSLYQAEFPIGTSTQNEFLDGLEIPSISEEARARLGIRVRGGF